MKNSQKNKKKLRLSILGFLTLIVVFLWIGYAQGFRFEKSSVLYPATLTLLNVDADIKVFVDGEIYKAKENKDSKIAYSVGHIPAGVRDVVIAKKGFWPWTKRVTLGSGEIKTLAPFFLPQSPSGEIITSADPEFEKLISLIYDDILPTEENPKLSYDKRVAIWSDGQDIFARWLGAEKIPESWCSQTETVCELHMKVTHSVTDIKNIAFYKNRNDIVLFSTGNAIYAIEISKDGAQNFEPAYTGTNPFFIVTEKNELYVREKEQLLFLSI